MPLRVVCLLDEELVALRPEVLDSLAFGNGLARKENFDPADQSSLFA
jgi:hypothetical protein